MSEEVGPSGGKAPSPSPSRKRGILSRMWNALIRGRGDDFEKKLQYLSKEEASVHARMKKRAHRWRKSARNIILFSVSLEVAAIAYAVFATRSQDLSWQRRAICVLPMFTLPPLSFAIYWVLGSLTKMFDRKDQKTLESLRMERQAKIDELKEKTNFYATQQLIQRYDLDPAAKVAAATVLASKLGAETGMKVYLGDNSKTDPSPGSQRDEEEVRSEGMRNRKRAHRSTQSTGTSNLQPNPGIIEPPPPPPVPVGSNSAPSQLPTFVEHYQSTGSDDGSWIARIAAMLVGEDPTQSYALICGNCRRHNGLAKKEDFPHVTYFCPHCHAFNGPKQEDEHQPSLDAGDTGQVVLADCETASNNSGVGSVAESEIRGALSEVDEEIPGDIDEEPEEQSNNVHVSGEKVQ